MPGEVNEGKRTVADLSNRQGSDPGIISHLFAFIRVHSRTHFHRGFCCELYGARGTLSGMRNLLAVWVVVLVAGTGRAADWTEYRGSARDGISTETSAPLNWSAQKNVKWRTPLPQAGNSSPIVSRGKVFVTCAEDAKGFKRSLYCFDRADGRVLWVKTVAYEKPEPSHGRNPYCASTPAADGERVVVWHGSAGVRCYDYAGRELWSRDLGTFHHIWGYAASPIFYGNSIILNCGPGSRSFVTALDRETGRTLWEAHEADGADDKNASGKWVGSWATPSVAKIDGQDQVLVPQSRHVNAYDPASGKVLWTLGGTGDLAYADLMIGNGTAVSAGGYGGPAIGFRLGGSGDVTESNRLWRVERNPQRIGTGVVLGPYLYMVSEPGVSCIELATGREIWKHREEGETFWGSLVAVGDRLYVTSQKGTTFVFAADPKGYRALAANPLGEPSNSTPAVSNGQLFLRTASALYCIDESH